MSKHQLLYHWPSPVIVRNVAKFVGFVQFHSRFILNFEVRIAPLCKLMREEYTEPLGAKWTLIAIAAWNNMRKYFLKDPCPCLCQYDHRKILVLCTNPQRDLGTLHVSQLMTMPPCTPCINVCTAAHLTS